MLNVMATMEKDETMLVANSNEVILGVGKLLVEKHGVTKAQHHTDHEEIGSSSNLTKNGQKSSHATF